MKISKRRKTIIFYCQFFSAMITRATWGEFLDEFRLKQRDDFYNKINDPCDI